MHDGPGAHISTSGASPIPAHVQTRVRRIVAVTGNSEQSVSPHVQCCREELNAMGYQEGRNISFEIGYAEFSRHILQADQGCDFDFLETSFAAAVSEPEIF